MNQFRNTYTHCLHSTLFEHLEDGCIVVDRERGVLLYNASAQKILGVGLSSVDRALSDGMLRFYDTSDEDNMVLPCSSEHPLRAALQGVAISGGKKTYKVCVPGAAKPRWVEWSVSLLHDPEHNLDGVLVMLRRLESPQIQNLYHHLFETHGEAMLVVDPATQKILAANREAAMFFEQEQGALKCTPLIQLFEDEDQIKQALDVQGCGVCLKARLSHVRPGDTQARTIEVCSTPFELDETLLVFFVLHDITEHDDLNIKLRAHNEHLEQSNQALQDFAYVASHDLQEPLRKVMAFSDRLKCKYSEQLDERAQDYLARVHRAANRMKLLIDNLLELSKVSTRECSVKALDVGPLIEDVLELFEVRIEETNAEVVRHVQGIVHADAAQIRQLCQNLIGNALKFHKPEQPPRLEIRGGVHEDAEGAYFELLIRDYGIGMSATDVDTIFEPFRRLHGRSSKFEGTGIGLALCRKIVARHGGSILAQSVLNEGTTFRVRLPLEARQLPPCMGGCLKS